MKRLFDIVASGCGLLVLSPVLLIVAIWIKLDSQGLFPKGRSAKALITEGWNANGRTV